MSKINHTFAELLHKQEEKLLSEWTKEQLSVGLDKITPEQLRQQTREFLFSFVKALQTSESDSIAEPQWDAVKSVLGGISRSRGEHGFSPSETAMFVFSLKFPVFTLLRENVESVQNLGEAVWFATSVLDQLALYTTEVHQMAREGIIRRQQEEMLELSTPVVKLWDGILALPMIGTLDSARTQTVMESLLQSIMETESEVAIIDITGVPTVDTLVAQHLIKTVTAARLMGADCIISGIRPQIAATIVQLGVELGEVTTKASLADAFRLALGRAGKVVVNASPAKNRPLAGRD